MVKCFCGKDFEANKIYLHLVKEHTARELSEYITDPEGMVKKHETKV